MMHVVLGVPSTIPDQIRISYEIGTTDILAVVVLVAFAGIVTALSVLASDDTRGER
jgi:hypothetical protein